MKNKKKSTIDEINNIRDELEKNYKIVNNSLWVITLISILFGMVSILFIIVFDAYGIRKGALKLEADSINERINEQFSMVHNTIDSRGYVEIFEQYMKTSSDIEDITKSIYYDSAAKALNNTNNISDEVVTTFVVSFKNDSILYSDMSNSVDYKCNYKKQPWYNDRFISEGKTYISNDFCLERIGTNKLFGIVKPVIDSMSDEALGLIVFSFDTDYLDKVFRSSTEKSDSNIIVFTGEGKVLFSTDKDVDGRLLFNENKKSIISYPINNEELNWRVLSYCSLWSVIRYSLLQIGIIILIFAIILVFYARFLKRLYDMKVIRLSEEIKHDIDLDKIQDDGVHKENDLLEINEERENLVEVDVDKFQELPIDEVMDNNDK